MINFGIPGITDFYKTKSVLFRGPALTQSGYGVHSRQVLEWLLSKNNINLSVQALPWGDTPWYVDQTALNGLIGKIMTAAVTPNQQYDVTFQLQLPNEWDVRLGKYNVGITAGIETDYCNPKWIDYVNNMNLVIVPSEHVKKAFENAGKDKIRTKIIVVPESFSNIKEDVVNDIQFDTSFNFLLFGQITGNNPFNDRKNTYNTIKWLCEAFKDQKDVGIVLKTNVGRNSLQDKNTTRTLLNKLLQEVRKGPYPKIHLVHGDLSIEDVSKLYTHPTIKALVTLSRGEGFGLPILEAASLGLPIISTNWSAQLDYLNLGKFIKIDYKLENVHQSRVDNNLFMKESKWAEANEQDFKLKIIKFKKQPEMPKQWALELKQKIQENYNSNKINNLYDQVLKDIL